MAEATRFETTKPAADRILIVEDEENARNGYEALLRRWGYEAHRRITTMFTLERMVDQTIAVYRSALSGSGSHGKATR